MLTNREIAPHSFDLAGRNVHIWTVRTEASREVATQFELVLAPDEKSRAALFRFGHLRHSFIIARGVLRILLGCYMDVLPASIQFKYGLKGKPALVAPSDVDFNVSHSGGFAVFAFTAACKIGIDVEQIRPLQNLQSIADQFFCPEEAAELMSVADNEREHSFFLCWTRKEAYIKAVGDGLSTPLNSFRVTLQPGQPARLVHLAPDSNAAEGWMLHDLQLARNHAAALAYRDMDRPVSVFSIVDPSEALSIAR